MGGSPQVVTQQDMERLVRSMSSGLGAVATAPRYAPPIAPNDTLDRVPQVLDEMSHDPEMVNDLTNRGWYALLLAPEIILGSDPTIQGTPIPEVDVVDLAIEAAYGDSLAHFGGAETVAGVLRQSSLVSEWLTLHSHDFSAKEKELIYWALASTPAEYRDHVVANAEQWLRQEPMETVEQRLAFLADFYNRARERQSEGRYRQSGFGGVSSFLEGAFKVTAETVNRGFAALLGNPDDYRWRQPLSLGQNIGISVLGLDPSDGLAWSVATGAIDGAANFLLDPWNYAFAAGVANKLSRTTPKAGRLTQVGRIRGAIESVIPVYGRRISTLPKFKRSPLTRMAFALMSKTQDELLEGMRKAGVVDDVYRRVRAGQGVTELGQAYPQFKGALEGVGQLLTGPRARDPKKGLQYVDDVMRMALSGQVGAGSKQGLMHLAELDLAARRSKLSAAQARAVKNGLLDPKSLGGLHTGIAVDEMERAIVFAAGDAAQVAAGSLLTPRKGKKVGDYIAFSGDAPFVTFDFANPQDMSRLLHWAEAGLHSEASASGPYHLLARELTVWHLGRTPAEMPGLLADLRRRHSRVATIVDRYADSHGIHLFGSIADGGMLTPAGLRRVIVGSDRPAAVKAAREVMHLRNAVLSAESRVAQLKSGGGATWFIKDFPTVPPRVQWAKPWRGYGNTDARIRANGWWNNFRHAGHTAFFSPRAGGAVNITDGEMGARTLTVFLRRLGLGSDDAVRWSNKFIDAHVAERYDVIRDAIEHAAATVEIPQLAYAVIEQVRKQGLRGFAIGPDGVELGIAWGRGLRSGMPVAVPLFPSHTAAYIQLPGHEIFTSLRRYRRANRNFLVLPKVTRSAVRGWAPHVKKKRQALVAQMARTIRQTHHLPPDAALPLSDDALLAMAYSVTRPTRTLDLETGRYAKAPWRYQDGLGVFANAGMALHRAYSGFHTGFSLAWLLGRPFPWFFRVALEENFRAALFDLPSLFRNPLRQMTAWHDAWLVSKNKVWRASQARSVNRLTRSLFDGLPTAASPKQVLAAIKTVLPDFETYLRGKEVPNTVSGLRVAFSRVLSREFVRNNRVDLFTGSISPTRYALRRAHRLDISDQKIAEIGLKRLFDFDEDASNIRNAGFTHTFLDAVAAGTFDLEWKPQMMSRTHVDNVGTAFANTLHQMFHDPIGKVGLRRIVARTAHGVVPRAEALALVTDNARAWATVSESARRVAAKEGMNFPDDVALAQWYLRTKVDPYIRMLFRPLLGDDPDTAARLATELLQTKSIAVAVDGKQRMLDFSTDNLYWLQRNMRDFVREQALVPEHLSVMPRQIKAFFEPRFLGESGDLRLRQQFVRKTMALFGDSLSQYVHRRPAYLAAFRDHHQYYTALGFNRKMARIAAGVKAEELTNHVFYNMSNAVPFLRRMNKVIPFFNAWWEVAQTWGYKIPMVSSWGVGYASMVRKVDRTITALIHSGILHVGEEDRSSPTGTRQLYVEFSHTPDSPNPVGRLFSRGGAAALQHFTNLLSWGDDPEYGDSDLADRIQDTTWRFSIGNPTDPGSHGIMAVNQFYLNPNPLLARGATMILGDLADAVDFKRVVSQQGDTLTALAERHDINLSEFMILNRTVLEEGLGAETAARLLSRQIEPALVTVPAGVAWKVPQTNLWLQMVDQFILPYGHVETDGEVLWSIVPGWFQHMLRGFGLWEGGAGPLERLEGEPEDILEVVGGFLDVISPPMSKVQTDGEVLTQMMYLEATEGMLTRVIEAEVALEEVGMRAKDELQFEVLADGTRTIVNDDHPLAAEWQERYAYAQRLAREYVDRATSNAAGNLWIRSLVGFLTPATPQMLYRQNVELGAYWYGQDVKDLKNVEGLVDLPLPPIRFTQADGRISTDYESFLELTQRWLADPEGNEAKLFLYENYPSLWAFAFPKTYWVPGGEPPEIRWIDDWARQVNDGNRVAMDPLAAAHVWARAGIRMQMEVEIRQRWGATDDEQAQNILNDWASHREWKKEFDIERAALEQADEWYHEGAYSDFVNRNKDEHMTLLTYLNDYVSNIGDVLLELSEPTSTILELYQPHERRVLAAQMRTTARELRSAVDDWREQYGPDYKPTRRDELISAYFKGPVASYFEALGQLHEDANEATDSEVRSAIYEQIRQLQNTVGLASAEIDGVLLPSPLAWQWGALDEEQRNDQLQRWVATKPEWLPLHATTLIAPAGSALEQYLPTTAEQFRIYADVAALRIQLADMKEPGSNGEPAEISSYEYNQMSARLQEVLERKLVAQGRGAEATWANMTPLQRLDAAGQLPLTLQPFVPMVNSAMDFLDQQEWTPGSDNGKRVVALVLGNLEQAMETNPQLAEDFYDLGERLYETRAHDELIFRLFFGEDYGEL